MSSTSTVSLFSVGTTRFQYLIAALLTTRSQAEMVAALNRAERPGISKAHSAEIKVGIGMLAKHIKTKRHREAIATMLVLLFIDAKHVIPRMRRDGVLRASKYGYKGHIIGTIAKAALQIRALMNATPDQIGYLESVIALSKLATEARALYDEIVKILQSRRDMVLKTLLVILNSGFYNDRINDPSQLSTLLHPYTPEDYSNAVSLIFSIYASLFPITDKCFNHVDVRVITTDAIVYERLLLAAIRLVKFKEAETFIDGLPYQATLRDRTITIASIDPNIERSVRLGYIQNENQAAIRARSFSKTKQPMSVRDFVEMGYERKAFDGLVEFVEQPVKRYRLRFPTAPEIFLIFSGDEMFRDEIENILLLDVNNFGDLEDLTAGVNEHVTTTDILKFQRYFSFVGCLYQKKLERVEDEAERMFLTYTSTVLVIPHDSLFMQMMLIFKSEVKVRALIDLLKMTVSTEHLDLQYRPLIDLGGHYVIAPHLLAESNLVRNTIVANRLRLVTIGPIDPMVKAVTDALKLADFQVEADFKLRANGQDLELDIVAWRDGHLFFFECKNAYHPCSAHEMRNSYDHIKRGCEQLDKRRQIFLDTVNQSVLFRKLGWAVEPTACVHTGIIIANRVFHGAAVNGHPVRQAHEFINVLVSGKLVGEDRSLSLWAGSTFQTDDLITYLYGDSLATKQLAALDPTNWEFAMGYRKLVFSSYVLHPSKLYQVLNTSYSAI
jgi:hypothetical protein